MLSENIKGSLKTTNSKKSSKEGYFDVIGIAVNLGSFKYLSELISRLPASLPASILVVQYMSPDSQINNTSPNFEKDIAEVLRPVSHLKVKQMENGERLVRGTIYTAMPNQHMIVNTDGTITLSPLDKNEFNRLAADVTFVTLAISHKDRAIGVLLADLGKDGALGAMAIKRSGGKIIAQENAETPGMPDADIMLDNADFIRPLDEIAPLLANLVIKGKPA